MFFPFFSFRYFLYLAPALLFMMYAQWRVRSAYGKWTKVQNARNIPGVKAAQQILTQSGLNGVSLNEVPGQLTDNYDPRSKTLNLSRSVAVEPSVASLAIVAHEIGHAEQDAKRNPLLLLRGFLVPAVNFGSNLGPILIIGGVILSAMIEGFARFGQNIAVVGLLLFSLTFVFALVTLPVEIDASRRAMRMLRDSNLLVDTRELAGARQVLNAAALTYIGGMLVALLQLLYYASFVTGRRD